MILSTHYITGAALASQVDSLPLIVILPIFLHFVLDMIPHWEYIDKAEEIKTHYHYILLDLLVGPLLILSIYIWGALDFHKLVWLQIGAFFSLLPDGASFLYLAIFPRSKALKKFFSLHQKIHNDIKPRKFLGISVQAVIFLMSLLLIAG